MRWKSRSFVIASVELSKYPMTDHIFAIAEATRDMFFAGMTIYDVDSEAVLAAGDNETKTTKVSIRPIPVLTIGGLNVARESQSEPRCTVADGYPHPPLTNAAYRSKWHAPS